MFVFHLQTREQLDLVFCCTIVIILCTMIITMFTIFHKISVAPGGRPRGLVHQPVGQVEEARGSREDLDKGALDLERRIFTCFCGKTSVSPLSSRSRLNTSPSQVMCLFNQKCLGEWGGLFPLGDRWLFLKLRRLYHPNHHHHQVYDHLRRVLLWLLLYLHYHPNYQDRQVYE